MNITLRYDGRFPDVAGENRIWTVMSHYVGPDGADYYRSSRMLEGLIELGILKGDC